MLRPTARRFRASVLTILLIGLSITDAAAADAPGEGTRPLWSVQPLLRSDPPDPPPAHTSWTRGRVDRFVAARFGAGQASPSDADRRTLLRRLSFDLTGLPPTYDDVRRFEASEEPQAYEALVDRLLASPQYGVRWARFWLDRARYSDVVASWLGETANAWLYRDWVTSAWNDGLPFDEFVRRQLAADHIDGVPASDLAALGFLGLSPSYWKELRLAPDVIRTVVAEEYDERIDAVTRTFLGLTVSCARCHDHKSDPITTDDYYALAGVFASTRLVERSVLTPERSREVDEARRSIEGLTAQLENVGPSPERAEEAASLRRRIDTIRRQTPELGRAVAHAVTDAALWVKPDGDHRTKLEYRDGKARDMPIYRRGKPSSPGPVVARRFLSVFSPDGKPFETGSGRLDLANAIVGDAAPLAARVIVNRIWAEFFGRGLVATPSNFGREGDRPSDPALLDDLAARFIEHGWSLRWLQREIVLSATYRRSSAGSRGEDDAQWPFRAARRRLPVEAWRDAMLAVSGDLSLELGGSPTALTQADHRRRTLYGTVVRRELDDLLRLHDFPDPSAHSPQRDTTITPLQQLSIINGPFVTRIAERLAERIRGARPEAVDRADTIRTAYRLVFARDPSPRELELGRRFLTGNRSVAKEEHSADAARSNHDRHLTDYAHALLSTNEFYFVD